MKFDIKGQDLKGLKKIKEVMEQYKNAYVKVGVFGGNHPMSGEKLVDIAELHEFGTTSTRKFTYKGKKFKLKGVPTRSFLRMPLNTKKSQLVGRGSEGKEIFKLALEKEMQHGFTGVALSFLGLNAVKIILEAFSTQGFGHWDRNINQEYIDLKGSDVPLIDTGILRSSITSKVVKNGGE